MFGLQVETIGSASGHPIVAAGTDRPAITYDRIHELVVRGDGGVLAASSRCCPR